MRMGALAAWAAFFGWPGAEGGRGVSPFPKRDGLEREEEEGGHGGGAMPREKEKEGGAPFPFSSSPSAFVVRIGRRAPNDPPYPSFSSSFSSSSSSPSLADLGGTPRKECGGE